MPTTTPPDTATSLPVHLADWRPLAKGSLRGFAKVKLGRTLLLHDVAVFRTSARSWAAMPGRPMVGADGLALRDAEGRQRYSPSVEWVGREAADRFSEAVIAEIERQYGPLDAPDGAA